MAIDQIPQSTLCDVKQLLALLTIEEKVSLLSGADEWQTRGIERLGIGSLKVRSALCHPNSNSPQSSADYLLDYGWTSWSEREADGRRPAGSVLACARDASSDLVEGRHQRHRKASLQRSQVKVGPDRCGADNVLYQKSSRWQELRDFLRGSASDRRAGHGIRRRRARERRGHGHGQTLASSITMSLKALADWCVVLPTSKNQIDSASMRSSTSRRCEKSICGRLRC